MKVVVIGAGVAGATAAHVLRQHGAEVVVVEAGAATGGRTLTFAHEEFAVDSGAIFVMGSYTRTLRYLRESGHSTSMRRWIATAAIMDESGTKHTVRYDRPWTLLRMPQLTWRDRAKLVRGIGGLAARRRKPGPFDIDGLAAIDDGTTLAQWAHKTFGDRVYEYVVRPLMGPLTGADPNRISAAFTKALLGFPFRTQLTVPDGGLGRIVAWLLDGIDVRLRTPAAAIVADDRGVQVDTPNGAITADGVVVAVDVTHARALLEGVVDPSVLDALDGVGRVHAHHVLFGYREDPWPGAVHDLVVLAGAGAHPNYGVLLNSRRHRGSTPARGQTVSVWFDTDQSGDVDENGLVALAREAVDTAFGAAEPDFHEVIGYDVALIAPVPGHYERMRAARDAMPARLRLAGDFLTHSGIEGAMLSGERAALDLLGDRARTTPTATR